jgi:hypothetical protein
MMIQNSSGRRRQGKLKSPANNADSTSQLHYDFILNKGYRIMSTISAVFSTMRWKAFTVVMLFNPLFLFAVRAQGATYYVDSIGGNDSNGGVSISTPWQTIERVNSSKFSPGDQILFKSGDTWREQLNVTSSGSPANPILFGFYGSGSPPIISGGNLATGWTSGNYLNIIAWSIKVGTTNQLFEDGTRLASSASLGAISPGSFYYDIGGGTLYVRTLADDNPNSHTMEISQRNYAIYEAGGSTYITLQNLQTQEANGDDVYFNGSAFITVSNMVMTNAFSEGIRFDVVASSTIVSSTATYNGSNGFSADDSPNLVIDGCVAHDNASLSDTDFTAGIKINPDFSPYPGSSNVTIENSESYRNGVGQPDWRGAGIWADTIGNNLLVQHNLVYGNNTEGIYFDAVSNETAAYNVVFGNGQNSPIDGTGIAIYGDSRAIAGDSVYGNTVYGSRKTGINVAGANLPNGCEGINVENNIVVGTVSGPNLSATGGCENSVPNGSTNVYTHNALGPQSSGFIQYGADKYLSSYAAYDIAYGALSGSVQGDPLFSNPSGSDFTLQSNSPAIGTGSNLGPTLNLALAASSTWPSGVVMLNQNSSGGGWDLGAYVHSQSTVSNRPAPPTNVNAAVQ